ncbi:conserved hypothetical protein [Sporisorium reilianum SRZ2]|uniref:Uncharacterized protein n=1 Tax=Sporisorium reilianum (strain SRZ2) TaxID=999809 RepID=E6ZMX2_SPORE|nr:conserved hypothetical protein [Sporisorium reilianum SRZ2]
MASRTIHPLTTAAQTHLTALETRWAGSLHLQMLSFPLRKCIVTQKVLPTSLMFQLKPFPLPPSPPSPSKKAQERIVMLPNQILHPKYACRKLGRGVWCTLDARVLGAMLERGSWKIVSARAEMGREMGALVWTQLGERVVQEAHVLAERFSGRKRLDLFHVQEDAAKVSFAIRMSRASASTPTLQRQQHAGTTIFEPVFKDPDQAERFETAIHALTPSLAQEAAQDGTVFFAKQSHITAPLGIALYRLNMWTSNSSDPSIPRPAAHKQATP